ncbi:ion transporter [Actinacidiphila glaucinigra]|uniref:ion transporter n=1 Tax=Actinacidiphila glaucinigra TaxID=235986 RepID=UPI0037C740D6
MAEHIANPPPGRAAALAVRCRDVVESEWFGVTVFALVLANAAVLGVETYDGITARWHGSLKLVEHCFLAVFTAEVVLRACAHADRPRDFLRDPWNLFDLAVVTLAYLPFARENATVLRLLRLARVVRAARFLPQLRIIIVAVGKSLPGTLSFLLVGTMLLYVYAMTGWVFFADADPEHYGSIGRAALSLFLLITLDGIGDAVHGGLQISRWSLLYYASYVLIGSFVLVNLLIGVVISSLEEARQLEHEREREEPRRTADGDGEAPCDLRERIATARRALDELEEGLALVGARGAGPEAVAAAAVPPPEPASSGARPTGSPAPT